jgi:hypothetical protein
MIRRSRLLNACSFQISAPEQGAYRNATLPAEQSSVLSKSKADDRLSQGCSAGFSIPVTDNSRNGLQCVS